MGSIFTGVGGFDMGFEAAGFRVAWQIEVDRDAVSVLERHWPDVPRHGDVRSVDPSTLAPVDVVVFGSPCQDFSVAGKRAGMRGERSGLFGEATRIIAGLRPKPAVCVWENVPGALSSAGGRDFGAALDALANLGALDIAWRVLDARHWGVPQRRRRVFVVGDLGGERAASILFEPEGGDGHPAPSGAAGEGAARDAADGAGVVGEPIAYQCHGNNVGPIGTLRQGNGGLTGGVPFAAYSVTASAGHHGHSSPRGDGSDNLVPVAFHMTQDPINGAESPALGAGNASGCSSIAVAISENQRSEVRETPYARQVTAVGGKAGQGYPAVRSGMAVRRLTPVECEKLMGWLPGWTAQRADGSEISDGPRYRMIGNGVVAPVAAWLAGRIAEAL